MKRLLNTSLFYAVFGLAAGLFYREFTNVYNFTGWTPLSVLHTHALMLGMFTFLILLLFEKVFHITQHKKFKPFYMIYNIGLLSTLLMLTVRGVTTVLGTDLSSGANAAISGVAGLAHILLTVAIIQLFILLYTIIGNENNLDKSSQKE
ncbi:MAG: DUF2871 domain-containing protein [Carnobacterium sp.]|uniref:DUF2871 domain-containing protein n=1 Tax=Carnobacterium sp. TaxID=48221 RepID=UPI002FC8169B